MNRKPAGLSRTEWQVIVILSAILVALYGYFANDYGQYMMGGGAATGAAAIWAVDYYTRATRKDS